MVDLVAIQMAIGGLKTAKDIAKAAIGIRDGALLQAKIIELNEVILSAQSNALDAKAEQAAMLERIGDLEKQIAQLEKWEAEKQRYELTEVGAGAFAYVIKPAVRGTEPVHCICTACYEHGCKSILQMTRNLYGSVTLQCSRCKSEVSASEDHPNYPLTREYAEDPREKARAALESCPLCESGKLAVAEVKPHPIFGDVGGLQLRKLKCDRCAHHEEREHDPNRRR